MFLDIRVMERKDVGFCRIILIIVKCVLEYDLCLVSVYIGRL